MDDFQTKRRQLWTTIDDLLATKKVADARQAHWILALWIQQHPGDVYSQEGGEMVVMMEEALTLIEAEKAAEPVAA